MSPYRLDELGWVLLERLPRPAEVQVDASALTTEEKALMLLRHARGGLAAVTARRLVRENGWRIVSHPHFTLERIRRFATTHLPRLVQQELSPGGVRRAMEREIREPTTGMRASFEALEPAQVAVLTALLDVPHGPVPIRSLAAVVRRHDATGGALPVERLVVGLLDHFLCRVGADAVTWVHPSWRDLVIEVVARCPERRRRFLAAAGVEGLLVALSTAGGAGERAFPLLVDDADWDELGGRLTVLATDVAEPELHRILLTLEQACASVGEGDDRVRRELEPLAASVLERVRNRWDGATAIPLAQLEAWFRLHDTLASSRPLPSLDRLWVELLPTEHLDLADPGDLQALDDWLTLVAILRTHAPRVLAGYGYPRGHRATVDSLVAQAFRLARRRPPVAIADRLSETLRRAARLTPDSVLADLTADLLEETDDRWFELRLEPGRPTGPSTTHDRTLVDRILLDL